MKSSRLLSYLVLMLAACCTVPLIWLLGASITNSAPVVKLLGTPFYTVISSSCILMIPLLGLVVTGVAVYKRNRSGMVYGATYLFSVLLYFALVLNIRV